MYGSAIPRVMSKHTGLQPSPEISHYDCTGVNCTQKEAWRPLDGDLESSGFIYEEFRPYSYFSSLYRKLVIGNSLSKFPFLLLPVIKN